MPFFQISLNDESPMIVGADDLDILTFGVMSMPAAPNAYLQVTSMRKTSSENEILFCRRLERGAFVEVAFQRTSSATVERKVARAGIENQVAVHGRPELAKRVGFSVQLASKARVRASVDDDSMLHVAANWIGAKKQCLFEIACIRMTENGQNQTLFELEIVPDQPFCIEVI